MLPSHAIPPARIFEPSIRTWDNIKTVPTTLLYQSTERKKKCQKKCIHTQHMLANYTSRYSGWIYNKMGMKSTFKHCINICSTKLGFFLIMHQLLRGMYDTFWYYLILNIWRDQIAWYHFQNLKYICCNIKLCFICFPWTTVQNPKIFSVLQYWMERQQTVTFGKLETIIFGHFCLKMAKGINCLLKCSISFLWID